MDDERPYVWPAPGQIDVDGVQWWACDPYPTWYRWTSGSPGAGDLITCRQPVFPPEFNEGVHIERVKGA